MNIQWMMTAEDAAAAIAAAVAAMMNSTAEYPIPMAEAAAGADPYQVIAVLTTLYWTALDMAMPDGGGAELLRELAMDGAHLGVGLDGPLKPQQCIVIHDNSKVE